MSVFLMQIQSLKNCIQPLSVQKNFEFSDLRYPLPVQYLRLSRKLEIAYVDEGKGGETILFVHGLGSYIPSWAKLIPLLKPYYRCIALDLPCYGKSSKGLFPISIKFYAEVLLNFLQKLNLGPVHLCGHSMGGQIAMHFTYRYPQFVKDLILVAPAGFENFSAADRLWYNRNITALTINFTAASQIRKNIELNFYRMPPDAEQMIRDRILLRNSSEFSFYCRAVSYCILSMIEQPVRHLIPHISHKTHIIFGENDYLIPNTYLSTKSTVSVALEGKNLFPNATLKILSECGHFVMFEKPQEVAQFILESLNL
ncbi:MAG: alpha/beta hydrolase [Bacteroidia bacterium]|nr:alpha/beta hydrolase [Bacteroidia bacterium]MDW8158324.1 alpha/beta hydrolase [Bacteroidia bacterium]